MQTAIFLAISLAVIQGLPTTPEPNQETVPVDDSQDALKYLAQFGYLSENKTDGEAGSFVSLNEALTKLQNFAGLNETGELDEETKILMKTPRCGLPDQESESQFDKRYVIKFNTGKWRSTRLSYRVYNYPTKSYNLRSSSLVNRLLSTAFNDWSKVSSLSFYKTSSFRPNIKVAFASRSHGDRYPFDGRGRTLAHAFFPRDGRMHFDNDERWSSNTRGGPNLRQVATHEVGHLLGLSHSRVRNAIMFPYYRYRSNFKLHSDDINGIVRIYGGSGTTTTKKPVVRIPWWKRWFRFFKFW